MDTISSSRRVRAQQKYYNKTNLGKRAGVIGPGPEVDGARPAAAAYQHLEGSGIDHAPPLHDSLGAGQYTPSPTKAQLTYNPSIKLRMRRHQDKMGHLRTTKNEPKARNGGRLHEKGRPLSAPGITLRGFVNPQAVNAASFGEDTSSGTIRIIRGQQAVMQRNFLKKRSRDSGGPKIPRPRSAGGGVQALITNDLPITRTITSRPQSASVLRSSPAATYADFLSGERMEGTAAVRARAATTLTTLAAMEEADRNLPQQIGTDYPKNSAIIGVSVVTRGTRDQAEAMRYYEQKSLNLNIDLEDARSGEFIESGIWGGGLHNQQQEEEEEEEEGVVDEEAGAGEVGEAVERAEPRHLMKKTKK